MQVDISQTGPWLGQKVENLRELFSTHVRETSFPEQFNGVVVELKPPQDRGFRIVRKNISIDIDKREGALVPCSLCGYPKFKNDGMLIIDEMGWLYLIGPMCGAKHYEGRFRDEDQRFDREQAEIAAQKFLLENINNIIKYCNNAGALHGHIEAASLAHERLSKSGRVVTALRRALNQQDGWLQVDEERRVLQPSGEYRTEFHPVRFSRINGAAAVRQKCDIRKNVREAISVLSKFGLDENNALEYIIASEADGLLPELSSNVRDSISKIYSAHVQIEDFQAFFSKDNYQAIGRWAADQRCPIRMSVEHHTTTCTLVADQARQKYPIKLEDLMRSLPLL